MKLHLTTQQLEDGLEHIKNSPKDITLIDMIVCRPNEGDRKMLQEGYLDKEKGLVGDNWLERGSLKTADGSSHPEMQLNIMNSRSISLIAQQKDRWPLAGDQLFIDINLTDKNIPAGTKLSVGQAIVEVTAIPHNGCKKFTDRFGIDAVKFVNSSIGKELHLRGVNAKIIKSGIIKVGDMVKKIL